VKSPGTVGEFKQRFRALVTESRDVGRRRMGEMLGDKIISRHSGRIGLRRDGGNTEPKVERAVIERKIAARRPMRGTLSYVKAEDVLAGMTESAGDPDYRRW